MSNPRYSLELRQQIIDAYSNTGISQRKIASKFGVSVTFVQKLLRDKRNSELQT